VAQNGTPLRKGKSAGKIATSGKALGRKGLGQTTLGKGKAGMGSASKGSMNNYLSNPNVEDNDAIARVLQIAYSRGENPLPWFRRVMPDYGFIFARNGEEHKGFSAMFGSGKLAWEETREVVVAGNGSVVFGPKLQSYGKKLDGRVYSNI